MLLMCKVASYVLTGLWRKEKFCVPLRVIRDVLHKEHPEVGYAAVAANSLSFVDSQFELGSLSSFEKPMFLSFSPVS